MVFQIDTGAALSVMNDIDFHNNFGDEVPVQTSLKKLQTYTGQSVPVVGECLVSVQHNGQSASLPLLTVKGDGPPPTYWEEIG